jgi:hypothetical protein
MLNGLQINRWHKLSMAESPKGEERPDSDEVRSWCCLASLVLYEKKREGRMASFLLKRCPVLVSGCLEGELGSSAQTSASTRIPNSLPHSATNV